MQRTENYRLFKPESTDNGSPEPFNSNADIIDAELNRLSTGLARVDNALVAAQDVLESGITAAKVAKLDALPTASELEGMIGKGLTSTLTAGQTSLTFTDASITANSTVDVYTSVYGVNPEDMTVSSGSLTLTFDAQSSDIGVKVVIK